MSSKVAALYIRVSTEDQTELSPDAQKRLLLDYAQKNDMIVSGDFIFTESVSGRHAQKRPEFQKMIALAKQPSHPIDVILVWKFSRFARNQEESIVYNFITVAVWYMIRVLFPSSLTRAFNLIFLPGRTLNVLLSVFLMSPILMRGMLLLS